VGYLLKQRVLDVDLFKQALDRVRAGASVIDPEVVAGMVAQGHSNTRIARGLVVTEKAVERNIAFNFDSLGLHRSRTITVGCWQ
jgi:DNA-binding NarL/FixJ family response regulator